MSEKEDPIQLAFEKTIDFLKSEKARIDSELAYCEKGLADHLSHLNKPAKTKPGPKAKPKNEKPEKSYSIDTLSGRGDSILEKEVDSRAHNSSEKIPGLSEALKKAEKEASEDPKGISPEVSER